MPLDLLRKVPGNPKSDLFYNCLDCRNHIAKLSNEFKKESRETAEANGRFFCGQCCKEQAKEEQATNKDGSASESCKACKDIEIERNIDKALQLKTIYLAIKLERIFRHEVSCEKCKCLYFVPQDPNDLKVIKIETYTKDLTDPSRYLFFSGQEWKVRDFLKLHSTSLELNILDLDHLPEEEQRKRGLLLPNETFIPKVDNVSEMTCEGKMRLESLKTQLACSLCHVEETVDREKGKVIRSTLRKIKLDYVNSLKASGCSCCALKDPKYPRKFDMDHIDPTIKFMGISDMVRDDKYTLEDLIKECAKCRVLCKHCHRRHTVIQRAMGIIRSRKPQATINKIKPAENV